MLNLERLGNITAELSANLVKSIVLPAGFFARLTRQTPGGVKLEQRSDQEAAARLPLPAGPLVLAGGCPVPDEVVVQVIHLCGGRSIRLGVVPVGAEDPVAAGQATSRIFTRFGMKRVEVLELSTRERADNPYWAGKLLDCDAVVLYGDDPVQAGAILAGTQSAGALHQLSAAGKPIIGAGAGAAMLAERFVTAEGQVHEGLGLAPRLVIDTEFTEVTRLSRLMQAVVSQPLSHTYLGTGLDVSTALFMRGGEARVVGEKSVTFVDGRDAAALDCAGSNDTVPVSVKVHVLLSGYTFNLRTRKPAALGKESVQAANG